MKHFILIGALLLMVTMAQAQNAGEARLQLGGDFGFDTEYFGVNFGGEYFITDQISAAPNFTVYFPEVGNASTLNVDARYYFTRDILQWYGLLGFTNNWWSYEGFKSSRAGANIGAGGVLKFADRLAFNPELKYQAQNGGQAVFRLGLVFFVN